MKFDPEVIYEESGRPALAWGICTWFKFCVFATLVYAGAYCGYLLWLEIF